MGNLEKQSGRAAGRRLPEVIVLAVILLVQAGMMAYFGQQKTGYHEDEMATYELSNLPGGFLYKTEDFLENWHPGDFFQYPLTSDGERVFDYSIPYHNQEGDVHPPLYYYVIHTVSSLFPGTFSKWIGLVPNFLLCMTAAVLLYLTALRVAGSRPLALLICAVWALGPGAMTTAVFIRMYALLTVWCLALVLAHLRAYREAEETGRLKWSTLALLLACTAAGILTQYFFLIFCFFLCGCFFLYLALRRRWGTLVRYTAAEFAAIGLSAAYFPRMFYHIFGGYRGKQAIENAFTLDQYVVHGRTVCSVISRELMGGWLLEITAVLAAAAAVCVLRRLFRGPAGEAGGPAADTRRSVLPAAALAATAAGYLIVVVKVAPFQEDRYYLCVYPLIVLALIFTAHAAGRCLLRNSRVLLPLLAAVFLGITALSYRQPAVNYLYPEMTERAEALAPYAGERVVCLNGDFSWAPDRWLTEYGQYSEVYYCDLWDFDSLDGARDSRDLSEGFLLYAVWPETTTEERLFEVIGEHLPVRNYELVTDIGCRVYYVTLEEA